MIPEFYIRNGTLMKYQGQGGTVVIPENVTSIDILAFKDSAPVQEILVSPQNSCYASHDGILYDKHLTTVIRCPHAKSEVNLPETVRHIRRGAFEDCINLQSLVLPDNFQSMEAFSFKNTSGLCLQYRQYLFPIDSNGRYNRRIFNMVKEKDFYTKELPNELRLYLVLTMFFSSPEEKSLLISFIRILWTRSMP